MQDLPSKTLTITLMVAFVSMASGVDRTKFKSCEQSSFCQRNRNHQPFEQQWVLDMNSVKQDGLKVIGELHDTKNADVKLQIDMSLTNQGALRLKIDELQPTRARFEAKDALNPSLTFKKLEITEKTKDKCTFVFGKMHGDDKRGVYRLTLTASPFRAQVTDSMGKVVVDVNSKGLMRFEEHKGISETSPKQEMFGAPKQAQAYDEAGRPINAEDTKEVHEGEQGQPENTEPTADTSDTNSEVKTYSETFSTFTDSRPFGPMSVGMDIYFPNSDHVYGIPEHADRFSLRDTRPSIGDPYRLYNVDIFEYELDSPMALYGSIPFMMSHSKTVGTFGVYWLNPSDTWIDIESNHSHSQGAGVVDMISSFVSSDKKMSGRLTHWFSETGLIDMWFLPGPDPSSVVSYNAELFGTIPMPPVYSIGYHQCRWNYYSAEEVMQVDHNYDQVEVPLDAIWLDIEYTAGRSKKYFTWDPVTFPDPPQLANNLSSKGRRLIAIIDPHLKRESGYDNYEEGTSMDLWVKDAAGHPYEAWCWPGASMWPDFLSPRVREWWSNKFDPNYFPGAPNSLVDIWNDMNEPSVFSGPEVTAPRDLKHVDGWEHRDVHNMYGFYMTKSTFEGMSKFRTNMDRPFILTRSFFAGSQRYCAAWTGDNQANWGHLKATVPMLLSLSISGMPFVGADVGGFFNNPESDELLIRWQQAGAFQPFFRGHAHHDAKHREVYRFRGQTLDLLRNAISLRYSYGPYWYTLFYEAHSVGMPMMRPLWFYETDDDKTYSIEDQYLLGYSILVKPILDKGVTSTDVYLPGAEGQTAWFDLNSHTMHSGGKSVSIPIGLNIIPLFQRAGTIVPRYYRLRRSFEFLMKEPVTLDVVLGHKDGKTFAEGNLYQDQYKKLQPDTSSVNLKNILFYDDTLYVRSSGSANLSHGAVERITIYNWPSNKKIISMQASPESEDSATPVQVSYKLNQPRQDGTVLMEIKKPQASVSWKSWMLKIDVAGS